MEHERNTVVGYSNTTLYVNSRIADYTLRIAYATSRQTRKRLERELEEFKAKHGVKSE